MKFDWNPAKAAVNVRKHGVSFEEASEVFFDPFMITVDDHEHSQEEQRERSIGVSARRRVLLVVHTRREVDMIRIISARKATRQEVQDYEAEVKERLEGKR